MLASAVLVLFVLPLCIAVVPPPSLSSYKPALIAEAAGSVIVLFLTAFFLVGKGMLLKTPLRVYDKGLLIQPILSTTPSIIAYADISSIEIWYGGSGRRDRSGCFVLSRDGKHVSSVETFRSKADGQAFIGRVSSCIQAAGFTMRSEEDEGSFMVAFRSDSLVKSPASSS